ncbi:MAG: hypothetical protein JXA44_01515 [Methanospirillaceae archaeon]|nr:hypothetical protein [Methanospirillaceae archaeon]
MAGKIKHYIDNLIEIRSQGISSIATTTRTKLLLKGIDTTKYTESSDDDPAVIEKIKLVAEEMGIILGD